tara:strand:+ start:76 stop:753 length:678 start_codon:yes stop_codon:yes gene_type:complete
MTLVVFTPSHTSAHDEYISLTKSGFYFSSKFLKNNNLQNKLFVVFYTDSEDIYKFCCEFLDKKNVNSSSLIKKKGVGTLQTKASEYINSSKILKNIKEDRNLKPQQRKFNISLDRESGKFCFRVIPNFEKNIKPNNFNDFEDVKGVYRYRNTNDEIIYIGKGWIKKNFKRSDKKSWIDKVSKIEYSEVSDENDQFKFEEISIAAHKIQNNGKLPKYNILSGRAPK